MLEWGQNVSQEPASGGWNVKDVLEKGEVFKD